MYGRDDDDRIDWGQEFEGSSSSAEMGRNVLFLCLAHVAEKRFVSQWALPAEIGYGVVTKRPGCPDEVWNTAEKILGMVEDKVAPGDRLRLSTDLNATLSEPLMILVQVGGRMGRKKTSMIKIRYSLYAVCIFVLL